jgi:predicted PurR-regulated permease PerM
MQKIFFKPFLIFLVILSIAALFFLFRPFMVELIIAAVLVSVFYKLYEKLTKVFWNKKYLASFATCLLLLLVILIPMSNLIVYASKKASVAYSSVNGLLNNSDVLHFSILEKFGIDNEEYRGVVNNFVGDITKNINDWLVSGANSVVKGTSKFIVSLILIVFTMFFFFVEGKEMAKKQ